MLYIHEHLVSGIRSNNFYLSPHFSRQKKYRFLVYFGGKLVRQIFCLLSNKNAVENCPEKFSPIRSNPLNQFFKATLPTSLQRGKKE